MFGAYRTLLALFVVAGHLVNFPYVATYAIVGFFTLSGYLMTRIMNSTYGYTVSGVLRFSANRVLRIFPTYWATLLLSALTILWVGQDAAFTYRSALGLPTNASLWLQNITMVYLSPLPSNIAPRVAPATWALTIELTFYALIALGVSRSRSMTLIWFAVGLAWHLVSFMAGMDGTWRYHFIGAGSLSFSIGALIFHFRAELSNWVRGTMGHLMIGGLAFLVVFAISLASSAVASRTLAELAFYGNYLAQAYIVIVLSKISIPELTKADKIIGSYSYHIYLLHWTGGVFWAVMVFQVSSPEQSLSGVFVALCATLSCVLVSSLLTRFIDTPAERIRRAIKARVPTRPALDANASNSAALRNT